MIRLKFQRVYDSCTTSVVMISWLHFIDHELDVVRFFVSGLLEDFVCNEAFMLGLHILVALGLVHYHNSSIVVLRRLRPLIFRLLVSTSIL